MDIFMPFFYEKEEENKFESLQLYIEENVPINEEEINEGEVEDEENIIILEIM